MNNVIVHQFGHLPRVTTQCQLKTKT